MLTHTLKTLTLGAVLAATPAVTLADPVRVASQVPVAEAVTRLADAVEAAGARVFSVVNFAEGAASVGQELRPTTLVIFGSPKIGAAALQDGQTMAMELPLKILIYEDAAGDVWLMHDDPLETAPMHGLTADNPAVQNMRAALDRMAAVASGH